MIAIGSTLRELRLMGIGWSLHKNDGWRGQLQRVHRWHERVIKAANEGSPDLADFTFALFQNCYHLREWFQKTSKANPRALDTIFRESRELQVCRDICNGTKHLTLKSASVDAEFSICWEYDPAEPSKCRLVIIAGEKYDLLDLASRCVATLDHFAATQAA